MPCTGSEQLVSKNGALTERLTKTPIRGIPVEVPLGPEDGMPARCVVNADNLLTIPKSRLTGMVTALAKEKMAVVAEAVVFALDLGN